MSTYITMQGDRTPPLDYQLLDENSPIEGGLAGTATIVARFRLKDTPGAPTIRITPTITDEDTARLRITWPTGDPTGSPGTYDMQTVIDEGLATQVTFPNGGDGTVYDTLIVQPNLA